MLYFAAQKPQKNVGANSRVAEKMDTVYPVNFIFILGMWKGNWTHSI